MANQIFVERETFEKNGRTFFSYFIKGNIRGNRMKSRMSPPEESSPATPMPCRRWTRTEKSTSAVSSRTATRTKRFSTCLLSKYRKVS